MTEEREGGREGGEESEREEGRRAHGSCRTRCATSGSESRSLRDIEPVSSSSSSV